MFAKRLRGPEVQAPDAEIAGKDVGGASGGPVRRPWVIHPFLIGVFPIVSLFSHNVHELPASIMVMPIGVTLVVSFLLWLGLRLWSGDADRAGLATSLMVAAFFGFQGLSGMLGSAWSFLSYIWVYQMPYANPLVVLPLLAVATGAATRMIFRSAGDLARWTRALNAFTLILVALPTASVMTGRWGDSASRLREVALPASSKRGWTPDIYFIVLDGFARVDVMKETYGLDIEPFLKNLERREFFVARHSTSNYCQTRLSLSSTLNADYLDKLLDVNNPDLVPTAGLIQDNLARRLLRPLGYRFVTFATGFDPTEIGDADLYLKPRPGIPAFYRLLVEMTPLGVWLSEVEQNDLFSALRTQTLYLLDHLPTVAGIKGPTFTFAHVLAPHPPYVFGEHGEDVSPRKINPNRKPPLIRGRQLSTPEYVRQAYRDESAFLVARVDRMIDRILANSPEPPVIILQSDHGAFLHYHPDDVEATDLRERFGILNGIYVPGGKVEGLNDRMTSVNTFRAVLKHVIGAELPPLEQRNYFSTFRDPLKFIDVTERLQSDRDRQKTFQFPDFYPCIN